MLSHLKITILVDDKAPDGLTAEHGLAFWIEFGKAKFLFDTGQGAALEGNARALGIDLAAADMVALSHGHYDHSGGLPLVLLRSPGARLHCHPGVMKPRYSIRDGVVKAIGMPEASRNALDRLPALNRAIEARPVLWSDHAGLTGPIQRRTTFETTGGPFFLDPQGTQPDPIEDDQALWVRTSEGVVVVAGCCHSGLINTLTRVAELSRYDTIRAVIGGFHLLNADGQRLDLTIEALRKFNPGQLIPCHCTGEGAVKALSAAFGERVIPGRVGNTFEW
ncbi:MAG TPA: MBL fold metallo-hydrolase [Candidatus Ozemobacteraceae bacterium]|nr:MBL fold metallo-hydrolase [Candidatus Ozemobacteraceae bacterium]